MQGCFFESACTLELFEAQAYTLCYHSSAAQRKKTDLNSWGRETGRKNNRQIILQIEMWGRIQDNEGGRMERKTQRGMDDSLWRRISHCARRQRCLHGLFSTVSSNGCVCVRRVRRCSAHSLHGTSRQCCVCLDSGCSSVDGNTQGREGPWRGGEQDSANWDRRSGSGRKEEEKGRGAEERRGVLKPSGGPLCLMMRLSRN